MALKRDTAAFASEIINNTDVFDYWIVRHPDRLSHLFGFCDRGREVLSEISMALQPTLGRTEMPDQKPKPKGAAQTEKEASPKHLPAPKANANLLLIL